MIKQINILTTIMLILSSSCIFSYQTNWKLVDTRPDTGVNKPFINSQYRHLKCYDSLNCMIGATLNGSGGNYFRRTTDGGNSWKNVYMDSAYYYSDTNRYDVPYIRAIAYPGPKLFIAVGDSGLIVRTTDKGETWEKKQLNDSIRLVRIIMANENFGLIQGSYYNELNHIITLITRNSGVDWEFISPLPLSSINFISEDTLIAIYYYHTDTHSNLKECIAKVTNNYSKYDTSSKPDETQLLIMVNDLIGWVAGGMYDGSDYSTMTQKIAKTTDGGYTWETQRHGKFNGCPIECIDFFDDNFGIASTCLNQTMITTDGGKTWAGDTLERFNPNSGLAGDTRGLQVTSSTTAYIILEEDYVYKYTREPVGVEEEQDISENFCISPNPATDYIEIFQPSESSKLSEGSYIRIYNVFGEEVNLTPSLSMLGEGENNPLNPPFLRGNLKIDVSLLTPGLYFVRVGGRVGKFVKI